MYMRTCLVLGVDMGVNVRGGCCVVCAVGSAH